MTIPAYSRIVERVSPLSTDVITDKGTGTGAGFEVPGLLDVQRESFDAFLAFIETDSDGRSELKGFLEKELGGIRAELEGLLGKGLERIQIRRIAVDRANEGADEEEECLRSGRTYQLPVKIEAGVAATEELERAEDEGVELPRREKRRLTRVEQVGLDAKQ